MKKLLLPILIIILSCYILLPLNNVEARQGCCSHHGGVCGCHCCDGTSLSATCAPYYPQCNTKSVPTTQNYNSPTSKESSGVSIWWWIIGIGGVGYLVYLFKNRKDK